jgi:UDP-N-acetylmuramoylalanine--D-glutamate ligase
MGETADEMAEALRYAPIPCLRADTMARATALALSLAEVGGSVLLSPAAASFDLYPDYRARGDDFAALCRMQK